MRSNSLSDVSCPISAGKLVSWLPSSLNHCSDVSCPISAGKLVSRLSLRYNHCSDVSCPISAGKFVSSLKPRFNTVSDVNCPITAGTARRSFGYDTKLSSTTRPSTIVTPRHASGAWLSGHRASRAGQDSRNTRNSVLSYLAGRDSGSRAAFLHVLLTHARAPRVSTPSTCERTMVATSTPGSKHRILSLLRARLTSPIEAGRE